MSALEYSQGVCVDGAAILKDGVMMTADEIVQELLSVQAENEALRSRVAELEAICENVPEGCTPADARVLREANHALAAEVAQAKWHKDIAEAALASVEKERDELRALVEALTQEFPLFDDDGLDETEHHCEWALQQDRKRLHRILVMCSSHQPKPVATAERLADATDADPFGNILVFGRGVWFLEHYSNSDYGTHWLPTGLTSPAAPGGE